MADKVSIYDENGELAEGVERIRTQCYFCHANCGVLAYVKDGDRIAVNIPEYSIELKVSPEEIEARKATVQIKRKTDIGGCLARYAAQVSSADKGAVINKFKN